MSEDPIFEQHRSLLEGIAYRMCGIIADAQDIVQETYLRWREAEQRNIREPRAWLVTVCSRLALDLLKSSRAQRETYIGTWLPEPFLVVHTRDDPAEQAGVDETVSIALMLALEKLSPAERATFLLHDVFGYAFNDIATILKKSEPACRKLASRARIAIKTSRPRFSATEAEHKHLLAAFFEAAHSGDITQLQALLTSEVELHSDSGGLVKTAPGILRGPEEVSRFFTRVWRESSNVDARLHLVEQKFNGQPGVLIMQGAHRIAAISLAITDGKISRIFAHRNPHKLAAFAQLDNGTPHISGQ